MSETMHHGSHGHSAPVHSEPHSGPHADTSYEGTDASVGLVLGSLSIIALTLVITALLTFPIQNLLKKVNPPGNLPSPIAPARVIPQRPRLQVHPWNTFPELRAHEEQVLNSSGSDNAGRTHVPIDQAIDQVATQLPVRPDAGPGLTVPGGQGRDFAGSLNGMPAPYQAIEQQAAQAPAVKPGAVIQGEIRKNAKK